MAYLKDAYEEIYKHPSWEKTAKDYETGFASNLYHAPFVRESARSVLVRFSKLFQTYYGIQDIKKKKQEDPLGFDDQAALADLAEEMSGDKIKYSPVLEDTLLAPENEDRSNGAGQIGNARRNVLPFDEEGDRKAEETNRKNIEDVINEDGNLREQMTMLYNAAFMNGGRTPEEIREGRSLKNLLVNLNRDDVEMIQEVGFAARDRGLAEFMPNMNVIRDQEHYKEKGDVFDPVPFATRFQAANDKYNFKRDKRKGWWKRFTDKVSKGWFALWHRRKYRDRPIPGLGIEHYTKNNMPLSQREQEYGVDKKTKLLKWQEGGSFMRMRKTVTSKGMLQITGPSGTTMRMMGAYKMLGASKNDLMFFRLALIAWLCGSRDHSLFEVLKGSWMAGIKGKEDTSEAARMYATVDPLSTAQIRINYAPKKEFPHETVYKIMLEELKQARKAEFQKIQERQAKKGRPIADRDESEFSLVSPEYEGNDAGDMAINVYTQDVFMNMAINERAPFVKYLGLKNLGLWNFSGNIKTRDEPVDDKGARREVGASGSIYNGSARYEGKNSKLLDQIYTMVRLSARMTDDVVKERSKRLDSEAIALQQSPGISATTFRGERKGGKHESGYTTEKLTSTTTNPAKAYDFSRSFYNTFLGSGIVTRMTLHGSGIYVANISSHEDEGEVLVPIGVQFRVTKRPYLAKIEEGSEDVKELTPEETRLLRTKKRPDNPLHNVKVVQAVDLEEVTSQAEEDRKKKHRKRMSRMLSLLEKRKQRLGVLQEEGKEVEALLKTQRDAVREANVPDPRAEHLSILDNLFDPGELNEVNPEVQKKEEEKLQKIEEKEEKQDLIAPGGGVNPVSEAVSGGGAAEGEKLLDQLVPKETGEEKENLLEDSLNLGDKSFEIEEKEGMRLSDASASEAPQEEKPAEKEPVKKALEEKEPVREVQEPVKEEPKEEEPVREAPKQKQEDDDFLGINAAIRELEEKKKNQRPPTIEEEVEDELAHMFGMIEREVTEEEIEEKRQELLAEKRAAAGIKDVPKKEVPKKAEPKPEAVKKLKQEKEDLKKEPPKETKPFIDLSRSFDSEDLSPEMDAMQKSASMHRTMSKVFVSDNGFTVFMQIRKDLEKILKEGAGKKLAVHTASEAVLFLAKAAAKDSVCSFQLRAIFQRPFETPGDRKKRVKELKAVIKLISRTLKKAGLKAAAAEARLLSK